jgi:hypothetical protein
MYSGTHSNSAAGTGLARSMLDSPSSWAALTSTLGEWMQMDLGSSRHVEQIVTQGRADIAYQWVTQYKVQHSTDGITFTEVPADFAGNSDPNAKVYATLPEPVLARYVRLLPQAWRNYMSMRAAVVGATTCTPGASGVPNDQRFVGNQPVAMPVAETLQNVQTIDASSSFSEPAFIVAWEYYAKGSGPQQLEVWRPISPNTWQLVCQNSVVTESAGINTVVRHNIPAADQCKAHPGDVIGWHHAGAGIIAFANEGGSDRHVIVWVRQNPSGAGTFTAVPNMERRDYSLRALWEPAPADESLTLALPRPPPALPLSPDEIWYRVFVARGMGSQGHGRVASLSDGNELFKNGVSVGIFNKGERWNGPVALHDEFYARGPIYGTVKRVEDGGMAGFHLMGSGRLKGRTFSFLNNRRADLQMSLRALENNAVCTVMTNVEVIMVVDIGAYDGYRLARDVTPGDDKIIKVVCKLELELEEVVVAVAASKRVAIRWHCCLRSSSLPSRAR